MPNYLLTLQYDGFDFSGWVKQKNAKTIQGELEKAFIKAAKLPIKMLGASKTDASVHALDQKVFIQLDYEPNTWGLKKALNKYLAPYINIKDFIQIDDSFRVRDVKQKTYVYKIKLDEYDVLISRYTHFWSSKIKFDLNKLTEALKLFIGNHDFRNFSGLKNGELNDINTLRSIDDIIVDYDNGLVSVYFKAKGFIRYQIRMIMGTVLAYLQNKVTLEEINQTLNLQRNSLPFIAPGNGLTLIKIEY